jgi:hypothetical protein
MLEQFHNVWGLFNPVQLSDYYDFWKTYLPGRGSALYDLLGARYLIAKKDTPLDAKFQPAFTDNPQVNVYLDRTVLPRAFAVPESAGGTHDQALQTIRAPSFDPGKTAVLEGGPAILGPGGPWPATITAETENSLALDVSVPQPAALVVTTPYYPGWKASLDGQPAALFRTDFAFQGVSLPAGAHHVSLTFDPPLFRIGAIVSAVAWLAAAVFILGGLTRRW